MKKDGGICIQIGTHPTTGDETVCLVVDDPQNRIILGLTPHQAYKLGLNIIKAVEQLVTPHLPIRQSV